MTRSFRDVIGLWATPGALAAELGVSTHAVYKWRQRDSIPPEQWQAIIRSRPGLGAMLTADRLTRMAAGERNGTGPARSAARRAKRTTRHARLGAKASEG